MSFGNGSGYDTTVRFCKPLLQKKYYTSFKGKIQHVIDRLRNKTYYLVFSFFSSKCKESRSDVCQ